MQRIDLRDFNKHVARQKLSIYYIYNNLLHNSSNMDSEFELPNGFYCVSNIHNYMEYIINKHETLTTIPHTHVYISRINNRLVFKIKGRYKLELKTLETMKLFGSTKN